MQLWRSEISAPSITIPTIKQRDLDGYEEITMCKSCRSGDPKYSHHITTQ